MPNEDETDQTNFDEEHLDYSHGDHRVQNTQEDRNMFSVPQTPTMKRKQKSHQSVDSQLVSKHLKQASDVLQSLVTKPNLQQNQKVEDGPALYGQLLAEKLRQLSPRNRLLVEHKIDNLVFEAQLQQFDSVTQSNFPRIVTVPSPCSSQESWMSIGSAYSPHQSSHTPSPRVFSTPPPTTNQMYTQPPIISPSQPQQHVGISHTSKNEQ